MAKPRVNQQSVGRPGRPRKTSRRSERIASSEAPQTSALQEVPLSVQTSKQGVNVSPLAISERQAGPFASSKYNSRSSRKRRKAEGKIGMEMSPDFQQRDKRAAMGIQVRSIALPCQCNRIGAQNHVLFLYRGVSLLQRSIEGYMTI